MNAQTAFNILQPLCLSTKDKKELAGLLNGVRVLRAKKKGISISWAKHDFKNRLTKCKI